MVNQRAPHASVRSVAVRCTRFLAAHSRVTTRRAFGSRLLNNPNTFPTGATGCSLKRVRNKNITKMKGLNITKRSYDAEKGTQCTSICRLKHFKAEQNSFSCKEQIFELMCFEWEKLFAQMKCKKVCCVVCANVNTCLSVLMVARENECFHVQFRPGGTLGWPWKQVCRVPEVSKKKTSDTAL